MLGDDVVEMGIFGYGWLEDCIVGMKKKQKIFWMAGELQIGESTAVVSCSCLHSIIIPQAPTSSQLCYPQYKQTMPCLPTT